MDDISDIPWFDIAILYHGTHLLKFGRIGNPHFRYFFLSSDAQELRWSSPKKADDESTVLLSECTLAVGQTTEVFKRHQQSRSLQYLDLSFSLIYNDVKSNGKYRSLDLVCTDRSQYRTWTRGLRFLIEGPPPDAGLALWSTAKRAVVAVGVREHACRLALLRLQSEGGYYLCPIPLVQCGIDICERKEDTGPGHFAVGPGDESADLARRGDLAAVSAALSLVVAVTQQDMQSSAAYCASSMLGFPVEASIAGRGAPVCESYEDVEPDQVYDLHAPTGTYGCAADKGRRLVGQPSKPLSSRDRRLLTLMAAALYAVTLAWTGPAGSDLHCMGTGLGMGGPASAATAHSAGWQSLPRSKSGSDDAAEAWPAFPAVSFTKATDTLKREPTTALGPQSPPKLPMVVLDATKAGSGLLRVPPGVNESVPSGEGAIYITGDGPVIVKARALALALAACALRASFAYPRVHPSGRLVSPAAWITMGRTGSTGLGASPSIGAGAGSASSLTATCGLASSARAQDLYSCGDNSWGQAGHVQEDCIVIPRPIGPLLGRAVKHVACGEAHTLAVVSDSSVFVWGCGRSGRLGTGGTANELTPRQLVTAGAGAAPFSFARVACGARHSMGIGLDGSLWSWGDNSCGYLGLGDQQDRLHPHCVSLLWYGGARVRRCDGGQSHTVVCDVDGRVFSMGSNETGALGLGQGHWYAESKSAKAPPMISVRAYGAAVRAAPVYAYSTLLASSVSGDVHQECPWPVRTLSFEPPPLRIERGSWRHRVTAHMHQPGLTPHDLANQELIVDVAAGDYHTVAVSAEGSAFTWGGNACGQCGVGHTDDLLAPTRLRSLASVAISGSGGAAHSALLCSVDYGLQTKGKDSKDSVPLWLESRLCYVMGSACCGQLGHVQAPPLPRPRMPSDHSITAKYMADQDGDSVQSYEGEDESILVPPASFVPLPTVLRMASQERMAAAAATAPRLGAMSRIVQGGASPSRYRSGTGVGPGGGPLRGIVSIACGAHHTAIVLRDGQLLVCGAGDRGYLAAAVPSASVSWSISQIGQPEVWSSSNGTAIGSPPSPPLPPISDSDSQARVRRPSSYVGTSQGGDGDKGSPRRSGSVVGSSAVTRMMDAPRSDGEEGGMLRRMVSTPAVPASRAAASRLQSLQSSRAIIHESHRSTGELDADISDIRPRSVSIAIGSTRSGVAASITSPLKPPLGLIPRPDHVMSLPSTDRQGPGTGGESSKPMIHPLAGRVATAGMDDDDDLDSVGAEIAGGISSSKSTSDSLHRLPSYGAASYQSGGIALGLAAPGSRMGRAAVPASLLAAAEAAYVVLDRESAAIALGASGRRDEAAGGPGAHALGGGGISRASSLRAAVVRVSNTAGLRNEAENGQNVHLIRVDIDPVVEAAAAEWIGSRGVSELYDSSMSGSGTLGGGVGMGIDGANVAGISGALGSSSLGWGCMPVHALRYRAVTSVQCGGDTTMALVSTQWIQDSEAPHCMRCQAAFSIRMRKHHCRACGGIFCSRCSSHSLPLLRLGYVDPVRVCDGCFARFVVPSSNRRSTVSLPKEIRVDALYIYMAYLLDETDHPAGGGTFYLREDACLPWGTY